MTSEPVNSSNSSRNSNRGDSFSSGQPTSVGLPQLQNSDGPSSSVHQHLADPASNRGGPGTSVNPYLLDHPSPRIRKLRGLPGSFSGDQTEPYYAEPPLPVSFTDPSYPVGGAPPSGADSGSSRSFLTARSSAPPSGADSGAPSSIADAVSGTTAGLLEGVKNRSLKGPKFKKAEATVNDVGFHRNLDPKSPSGLQQGSGFEDRLGDFAGRLFDSKKNPGLHRLASGASRIFFAPTIMAGRGSPVSYLRDPSHSFSQRVATHMQANRAFRGPYNNPLMGIASKAIGSMLSGDPDRQAVALEEVKRTL